MLRSTVAGAVLAYLYLNMGLLIFDVIMTWLKTEKWKCGEYMINGTVTVLLVEDDDIDAETVIHSFKQMKIANPVRHARDGEEAL